RITGEVCETSSPVKRLLLSLVLKETGKTSRGHQRPTRAHWTISLTDVSTAMPALSWSVAGPLTVSAGKRKFTWYPPTVPGSPTALSTSAGLPFTRTSTADVTTARGLEENGSARPTSGCVAPRPLANSESTSPGAPGLAAVTSL